MATQTPTLHLGLADEGRAVSSEEFADATFDEPWKYEREGGRLIVLAPSGEEHIDASEPWLERLIFFKRDHPGVIQRVVPEAWLRVDGGTDRIGDIGVFLVADGPVPKIPDRVPDMMFEIVSPDKKSRERDYVKKRADYHRFGVKEYVIVDRFRRTATVLTHTPDGYEERVLSVGEAYESPLLPGLSIRLAEVF